VDTASDTIVVAIDSMQECDGCGAKLLCNRDTSSGHLTVRVAKPTEFKIGETVKISATGASQNKAVRIGLAYPCLLLLATAAIFILSGVSQTVVALCALGSVAAYYGMLYLLSHKVNNMFRWTVNKLN